MQLSFRPLTIVALMLLTAFTSVEAGANGLIEAEKRAQALLLEGKDVPKLEGDAKITAVRDLLRKFVDSNFIAKSSLGTHYRKYADDQAALDAYYATFEMYLARFLAKHLTSDFALAGFFTGEPSWVGGANNSVSVKMKPINGSISGVMILGTSRGGNEYWITDLKVADISLIINFRTYVTGQLSSGGDIHKLIAHLESARF